MKNIELEKLLQPYTDGICPGCAVSVIENGETIYSYTAGYADIENNVVVNEFTNFRLASVTKQFMAVSILLLLEKN